MERAYIWHTKLVHQCVELIWFINNNWEVLEQHSKGCSTCRHNRNGYGQWRPGRT